MADRIEPFVIAVDEAALDDLRDRLRRTRWPERETVRDWSQGVPLAYLQHLCGYWGTRYDWPAAVTRLNRIPQFTTTVDGLRVHFLHVRSPHPGAVHRIARAWAELMTRLGYDRFLAEGSDWGTSVSTSLALQHPGRLLGIHLVPPLAPPDRHATDLTDAERAALADLDERTRSGSGYSAEHGTRPQTIGYSLTDSPVGLCAWIVEKLWAWTDHAGDLGPVLSADQVLDNITLHWLTGTAASSARLYWESIAQVTEWFTVATGDTITVPTGCSVFPKEVPRPSRRWAERRFANIVYWNEPGRGGHFAAWEQPAVFTNEVRAVARACTQVAPNASARTVRPRDL